MRVLNQIGPSVGGRLRGRYPGIEVVDLALDEPLGAGVAADVLLATHLSPALADLEADIPWVHVFGTGVDELPAAVYRGRVVTNSRGAGAVPISEFVLAAMLAFEKQLPDVWLQEPPQHWNVADLGGLHGRRLAVLGLGSIGSRVAELGLAFGMEVRGLRRHPDRSSPVAGVEVVGDVVAAVDGAHHVVVAAPSTRRTHHLVDGAVLDAMVEGVHLVNIARGDLVDHDALRAALDAGRVARASLDVCDPEPPPPGHWLYSHPRVRLTPHVSWSSPARTGPILDRFTANLDRRLAGRPLEGVVDPAEGY